LLASFPHLEWQKYAEQLLETLDMLP